MKKTPQGETKNGSAATPTAEKPKKPSTFVRAFMREQMRQARCFAERCAVWEEEHRRQVRQVMREIRKTSWGCGTGHTLAVFVGHVMTYDYRYKAGGAAQAVDELKLMVRELNGLIKEYHARSVA